MTNKILVELNMHNGHIATCACCKQLVFDYYGEDDADNFWCRLGLQEAAHEGYDRKLRGSTCESIDFLDSNF